MAFDGFLKIFSDFLNGFTASVNASQQRHKSMIPCWLIRFNNCPKTIQLHVVLYYHNKQYGQPPLEIIRENFIIPSEEHVKIYFHNVRATEFQALSRSVTTLITYTLLLIPAVGKASA